MKLFTVKRKTKYEQRFHKNMGSLSCKVTKIKLYLLNLFPIKTLYKYRETYFGELKDTKDCNLNKI